MALSNYLKQRRLNSDWGGVAYNNPTGGADLQASGVPTTVYIGLFSTTPNAGGGGSEFVIGSNAYARASVVNTHTAAVPVSWDKPALGAPKTNKIAIAFPAPTGSWGTATHFGIFDAATGGNLLEFGALLAPLVITGAGAAPEIPIGGIVLDSN